MATLRYIKESKDSRLLLLGFIGEGESDSYTVDIATYESVGYPSIGEELDDNTLAVLKEADELYRAKKKALSLLAYADNNVKTLRNKLLRAGFSRVVTDRVTDEMVHLGYVNERRQIERIILIQANESLRGPRKIIATLSAKGYSYSDINSVMNALVYSGEIDFKQNSKRLIDKKLPDDASEEEIKKLLYKNGYTVND